MKMSYKPDFIMTDGVVNGIYFNNGSCAEHEFGIAPLRRDFGIDSTKLGIDGRIITRKPEYLIYFKYKLAKIKRAVLMYHPCGFYEVDANDPKSIRKYLNSRSIFKTRPLSDDETSWISCGWSDNDFGIYVAGDENVEMLDKIVDAMNNNNLMMFVGNPMPQNPFSRGGLVFMIVSTLDDEFKKKMYDDDYDAMMLQKAAKPYIDMVKRAGLRYYALSPRWADEEKKKVVFWLNPYDQQNNYFGWVTTGDLKDWVKGKGIIPGHGFSFEDKHPEEFKNLAHNEKYVMPILTHF